MEKKIKKLTGNDLASYIEEHKQEFDGNGDKLCLAAGYGIKADDGNEKCDFSDFVKAFSHASSKGNQTLSDGEF